MQKSSRTSSDAFHSASSAGLEQEPQNPTALGQFIGTLMVNAVEARARSRSTQTPDATVADEGDLDEPAEEALDPTLYVLPKLTNTKMAVEADKMEMNDKPPVYLPLLQR